jgi:hypothetical protein
MSFDPDSISDRMDMEEPRKCRCGGSRWVSYERGNPYACEPCGCDVAEVESENERLRRAIEWLGETSSTCVYHYLETQCSYCKCGGKNMS